MLSGRAFLISFLIAITAVANAFASSSPPVKPDPKEYLPVSQIRPGMKGYGLTVFKGTKIDRFEVEVIDVLKNSNMANGRDLILVRMSGGPITERGANIIAGMSGSPVYINGKIVGAVSMGFLFPKEPIALVTPIEDMFDAFDPNLPDKPMMATGWPQTENGPASSLAVVKSLLPTPRASGICNLLTPFFVSGLSARFMNKLQEEFGPLGMQFMVGPGSGSVPAPSGADIRPGSAVGVGVVIGDINVVAVGTVTYRKGDHVLLFGHPLDMIEGLQLGAVEFPMMSAVVHDVFSGMQRSVKLSSPGQVIGTITRDRPWSVAGVIGKMPNLIPVTVNVRDTTTGRSKTFNLRTVSHPLLTPLYVILGAGEAVYRMHSFAGDCMAKVRMEVSAEGFPSITRENLYFASLFLDSAATDDLAELLLRLYRNAFGPVPVKSVKLDVELYPGRKTIRVERIYLDKDRVEPGETVKVGVVLRPWKGEPFVRTLELKVPYNAPEGRTTLSVYGGSMGFVLPVQTGTTGTVTTGTVSGPAEVNVAQIIRRFLEKDRNDDLVMKLYLNTPSVNIFGERLLNLPAPIASIMASSKSTGFRGERDEVKTSVRMDALVEGVQVIQLTVQRKSMQERSSGTTPPSQPSSPPPPPGTSRTGSATALDDGDEEEETALQTSDNPDDIVYTAAGGSESRQRRPSGQQTPSRPGEAPRQESGSQAEAPKPSSQPETQPSGKEPGRTAVVWTQRTRTDFLKGEARGAGVTSLGDVRLAAAFKPVETFPNDTYVWSIQPDGKGGVYLGTGNFGRIYYRSKEGKLDLVYDSSELEIHALAMDKQGNLYAGTSPNGLVLKITPDGQASELFKTGERYVLSLAVGEDGSIFAGTGSNGKLFRITPDGKGELFFQSPESHIMCLAVDKDGNILAGTADKGLLFRISKTGRAKVLYDADDGCIGALAVSSSGDIYIGTAPKGLLLKIPASGGDPKTLHQANASILGLTADGAGVYAAAGTKVYRVTADDTVIELDNKDQNQLLCLTQDGQGHLYAGSGNSAALYEANTAALKGTYESAVHDAGGVAQWGRIRWQASVPSGTKIEVQTRSGNVADPDSSWSPWSPVYKASNERIQSPPARFIQYRVSMESSSAGVTPELKSVSITYLPENRPPTVSFTAPMPGDIWSGVKTISWSASDPDKDTLTYELYYSRDGGATWERLRDGETTTEERQPAPSERPTASEDQKQAPKQPIPTAEEIIAQVNKELDKDGSLTPEDRRLLNAVLPSVVNEALSQAEPRPPAPPAAAARREPPKPITVTSFRWDTTKLPDGEYLLKVVASDKRSNPNGFKTAEKITGPVIIANEKPKIQILKSSLKQKDGGEFSFEALATSKRMSITAVSFRVDSGDWYAAEPADGVFDSPEERFIVTTDPLPPGNHTVEVKVTDSAGNSATQKVPVPGK